MATTLKAVVAGDTNVDTNWVEMPGGVVNRAPISTDECDLNGLAMIQAGGPLTLAALTDSVGTGQLTVTNGLTCSSTSATLY